jgi:hypothetical protein
MIWLTRQVVPAHRDDVISSTIHHNLPRLLRMSPKGQVPDPIPIHVPTHPDIDALPATHHCSPPQVP